MARSEPIGTGDDCPSCGCPTEVWPDEPSEWRVVSICRGCEVTYQTDPETGRLQDEDGEGL